VKLCCVWMCCAGNSGGSVRVVYLILTSRLYVLENSHLKDEGVDALVILR
jgi:hypothetical protein